MNCAVRSIARLRPSTGPLHFQQVTCPDVPPANTRCRRPWGPLRPAPGATGTLRSPAGWASTGIARRRRRQQRSQESPTDALHSPPLGVGADTTKTLFVINTPAVLTREWKPRGQNCKTIFKQDPRCPPLPVKLCYSQIHLMSQNLGHAGISLTLFSWETDTDTQACKMSTDSFMYPHTWFDLSTSKTEKRTGGTSLVAQRLRPCTPNAGSPVPSLVRELDPRGHNEGVHMPQLRPAAVKSTNTKIKRPAALGSWKPPPCALTVSPHSSPEASAPA